MSDLMTNFFGNGQTNGHAVKTPGQAKLAEYAKLKADLADLSARLESMRLAIGKAVDNIASPEVVSKAIKAIYAKKGYRVNLTTKSKKAKGDSVSPLAAIFKHKGYDE